MFWFLVLSFFVCVVGVLLTSIWKFFFFRRSHWRMTMVWYHEYAVWVFFQWRWGFKVKSVYSANASLWTVKSTLTRFFWLWLPVRKKGNSSGFVKVCGQRSVGEAHWRSGRCIANLLLAAIFKSLGLKKKRVWALFCNCLVSMCFISLFEAHCLACWWRV